jgi:colicin import membrane protein
VSESDRAAEAQSRIQQQNAALEAQRLAQADARAKAEAQASAKAEEVRLAMAQAEQRRKVQAEAIAKAEAEAKAKVEAETKAKADEAVRLLAMAAEAEKMKQAEALARTKAEIAARAKADAEQARAIPTVIASVAPASIPEPKSIVGSSPRHITNRVGLELILLAGDLWVGKFEVTQGEYVKVMGKNPSKVMGNPRLPVESVTWEDARRFCEKLGEMEKASGSLPEGFAYNLPTQEQWDLLIGGAAFPDAVTSQQGTRNAPALVGTLSPNNHGLHDVLGNVWEWCLDGPSSQEKALRGGAFNNQRTFRFKPLTPQTVHKLPPHEKSHDVGFRCVMARTQ